MIKIRNGHDRYLRAVLLQPEDIVVAISAAERCDMLMRTNGDLSTAPGFDR